MRLRAAIVGAGLMGRWHARSVTSVGGEVAVVCDEDEHAARSLARNFKGARACARINEAFEADKVDIVHVCTPLSNHFESAAAALSHGVHVLIEKPMAPDRQHTEHLYQLAAEHRVLLCPVHQFPFQRSVQKALAHLGQIGQLRHFETIFFSAGGAGKNGEELDHIVAEILPHPLSLMQLFAADCLRDESWTVHHPAAGELQATLIAQGISFSILISMSSRPTTAALRLRGTSGTTHVDLFHDFCVAQPGAVSRWRKIVQPFDLSLRTLAAAGTNAIQRAYQREWAYPGLRTLIRNFYAAIAAGSKPPIESTAAIEIAAARDLLREKIKAAPP